MEKQYSTPKVTIDLDEYNRLKDIEFQAFGILKGKIETENIYVHGPFTDPLADEYPSATRGMIVGRIKKEDLDYYFKNIFNIDKLEVKEGDVR